MDNTRRAFPASTPANTWLADAIRPMRILATTLLLMGWFIVVGTFAAVEVIRVEVIRRS
ncbi:MAG: hypothetical protein M3406_15970 [Chloroflexota bacterium]|nr:hypothetical protein [Chloroflexota bacterium]